MKRMLIVTAAVALVLAACGSEGAVPVGPVDTETPSVEPTDPGTSPEPEPTDAPDDRTMSYEVWFASSGEPSGPYLFVTGRTQPFDRAIARAALTALFEGPTPQESAVGVGTAVPAGTELLGISIADGVATVDLSDGFESGGGTASMTMRLAQVVYTLTQFGSVDGVNFRLEGRPVTVFGGEGIVLDHPATRRDFRRLLPFILVETPVIDDRIDNPVTIAGTANVFEATVSIRILDADGKVLVDTFTTATCGTGCRGTFSEQVRYRVSREQPGTIMVYESSAEDGSPLHVVRIPVTLTP
jgi:spore germination protein GerM